MSLLNLFLQVGSSGGSISLWITLAGVMIIFYLFMIMPQQRKQKKQQQYRDSLAKGDDVVTIGGIHGKIHAVDEHTVTLIIDKVKIVFDKQAISSEAGTKLKKEAVAE